MVMRFETVPNTHMVISMVAAIMTSVLSNGRELDLKKLKALN